MWLPLEDVGEGLLTGNSVATVFDGAYVWVAVLDMVAAAGRGLMSPIVRFGIVKLEVVVMLDGNVGRPANVPQPYVAAQMERLSHTCAQAIMDV